MNKPVSCLVFGLIAIAWVTTHLLGDAHAQSSLGIGTNEATLPSTGLFAHWLNWINTQQQGFYRSLTAALKAMREDGTQLWTLVGLSFAYGVFHAAGPGHGKAVISSYMLANEVALRRGILLSFVSAFLQALTAIVVMTLVFFVLRGTSVSMTDATWFLEVASYALITAFGAWLLWKKAMPRLRTGLVGRPAHSLSAAAVSAHGSHRGHHAHSDHVHVGHSHGGHDAHQVHRDHGYDGHHAHPGGGHHDDPGHDDLHHGPTVRHGVHDGHAHDVHSAGGDHDHRGHDQAHDGHDGDSHHAGHDHAPGVACATCGHSHAPDPLLLGDDRFSWKSAWSAVAAVGLRPCSGALIVLSFAFLNGLWTGGILSVLAMAVGTAITVSVLATLAVTAKNWAVAIAGDGHAGNRIHAAIEIGGAALVFLLGVTLLAASLSA